MTKATGIISEETAKSHPRTEKSVNNHRSQPCLPENNGHLVILKFTYTFKVRIGSFRFAFFDCRDLLLNIHLTKIAARKYNMTVK